MSNQPQMRLTESMNQKDWLKRQKHIPKIVILGAGNAGCLTALSSFLQPFKKELELIYDPSIPAEPVGMGTTPWVPEQLYWALEANWYTFAKEIECTPKFGILYKNWGKRATKISMNFLFQKWEFILIQKNSKKQF